MTFLGTPRRMIGSLRRLALLASAAALICASSAAPAQAKVNLAEVTQKNAETQIRHLIEPLLDKYCRESCKLLSVGVQVDLSIPDEIAPGFDDMITAKETTLAPSQGRIKILIDDKVGPISREKLKELLQQYLDTLDYAVRIEMQVAHFPQPIGSEGKIAEIRERIAKQFQSTINDLFQQFCPEKCMFADFKMQTEVVNAEEAQYGTPGEFYQDGGVAIKIRDISGTLLMDESLTPEERSNILEMAKLKTNSFKNVTLNGKALRFPRPTRAGRGAVTDEEQLDAYGNPIGRGPASLRNQESKETKEQKELREQLSKSSSETNNNSNSNTNSNSTNRNNTTTSEKLSNNAESKTDQRTDSRSNSSESNQKQERYERFEKIERVENGDAVQAELQKFKVYGLVFACSILSLLIFIAMASFRPRAVKAGGDSTVHRVIQSLSTDPFMTTTPAATKAGEAAASADDRRASFGQRYEIERLIDQLSGVFAQYPRVAKYVFSRILTEEGVETMAYYIDIFGESIVMDMLRDPSLQNDLNQLTEYYAKTSISMTDDEKLELLRALYNRTVAGKVVVLGNRSSNLFEFLAEMDATQIEEMIRTETITVKAIVLTQCDATKRSVIFSRLDEDIRMSLLGELSRIDYLPRDYIYNVSSALKRKRRENPKLNTDALPGSEVLVSLLERVAPSMQRQIVANLESANPESARAVKGKLVSIDTLRFLRDGQLLEVVLSLRHDELLQFLKGASEEIRNTIYAKAPKELVLELEEELQTVPALSREGYLAVERKILNRVKVMTNEGLINLAETNERMFASSAQDVGFVGTVPANSVPGDGTQQLTASGNARKVSGW